MVKLPLRIDTLNNHLQYKHKLLKVAREKKNSTSWWFSHIKEKHMKEKVITKIINEMLPSLNNEQLKKLKDVLEVNLYNVSIVTMEEESEQETLDYLEVFLSAKRIEGCSEKTLTYYKNTIHQMMEDIGKTVCTIETEDLRTYLSKYQAEKESSKGNP